jgi:hypothetical protein
VTAPIAAAAIAVDVPVTLAELTDRRRRPVSGTGCCRPG